jgi:hypothetical protein
MSIAVEHERFILTATKIREALLDTIVSSLRPAVKKDFSLGGLS